MSETRPPPPPPPEKPWPELLIFALVALVLGDLTFMAVTINAHLFSIAILAVVGVVLLVGVWVIAKAMQD